MSFRCCTSIRLRWPYLHGIYVRLSSGGRQDWIAGKYRFDLVRIGTDGIPASDWDLAPLGLKLIPIKVPTENIVI